MCGIAGIYRTGPAADDRGVVRNMLGTMRRRGPDGEGLEIEGGLTLGHRRLAIVDLSSAGSQPMRSASGRYLIAFNGEIYNFRELIGDLGVRREDLRSSSDTEVLLLAWERWGSACLDRLAGQWAFAIHDREEERLWLARDRFGEKPLFHHRAGAVLSFASSIGALLKAPWISREISSEALTEYLALRYVLAPRTVMKEVMKVPPGHLLRIDRDGLEDRRWWSPRFRRGSDGSLIRSRREATAEFGRRLVQASRRCTVGDVPVGLLLSDGIDSNGIHAALKESGHSITTYTYKAVHEAGDAGGTSAAGSRVRHEVSYDEIVAEIEPAFAQLTEPVGDGAAYATWKLIRNARERATVFLCGQGGDEVLGGYRLSQERFRLAAMHRLCRIPLPTFNNMVDVLTNGEGSIDERRAALTSCRPALVPAAAKYLIQRPLPLADLKALFAPRDLPERYLGVVDRLYAECSDEAADLDRMQEVMLRTFLSGNLLSFADSAAMASSAELRLPYLDRDLVDFVMQLPPTMRVSRWPGLANTKRILRWWAKGRVPESALTQRKRGFRFGTIRDLLKRRGGEIHGFVLGCLVPWIRRPPEVYRRGLEGTYWALLSLAIWGESVGAI
jgi:asparagine synthase (glutamine-hydrolysing)